MKIETTETITITLGEDDADGLLEELDDFTFSDVSHPYLYRIWRELV